MKICQMVSKFVLLAYLMMSRASHLISWPIILIAKIALVLFYLVWQYIKAFTC